MKKFITYLIYFAMPFVVLFCCFEIYLRQIDTTYTEKEKGILKNQKKVKVLILGNSRAALGFDPNQLDLYAYNLANVAQPFYYDKRITLKYLDKLTNLKYVFITLDYSSLDYSRMNSREVWSYYGNGIEYKDKMSFLSKNCYLKGYSASIAVQLLKNDISGKFKTIKALDLDNEHRLDTPMEKGFFAYKGTNEKGMTTAHMLKKAANGVDDGVSAEKKEIVQDLESFIQMLKARNITPILLVMPCHEGYVKVLNKNFVQRAETDFEMLSRKFGIEYWNYLKFPMERTDFHDCDHLNITGAVKFSKVVNERLNAKALKDEAIPVITIEFR